MYSFYWDVELDWGLALCEIDTWLGPRRAPDMGLGLGLIAGAAGGRPLSPTLGGKRVGETLAARIKRLWYGRGSISHQRSPCPTPGPTFAQSHPSGRSGSLSPEPSLSARFLAWGLRPVLLLPDPLVYHLFTLIDLVLRFTWSLKLSSHLHTISEIESGVFIMEALELVRRWMWVFVRIEWEAVKKGEVQRWSRRQGPRGQVLWSGEGDKEDDRPQAVRHP